MAKLLACVLDCARSVNDSTIDAVDESFDDVMERDDAVVDIDGDDVKFKDRGIENIVGNVKVGVDAAINDGASTEGVKRIRESIWSGILFSSFSTPDGRANLA